jgi:hypothetical protein
MIITDTFAELLGATTNDGDVFAFNIFSASKWRRIAI